MEPKRIKTDGGFYVQTADREWSAAIKHMQRQLDVRDRYMRAWERTNHPGCYPSADYWERYSAEKERFPVDYPMPWGHVMFDKNGAR